jgi:hypothetical protein
MKIGALLLAVLLCAAPAFAADIDGKWSGSLETPNGPVELAFTFKAEGATLTGTTSGPDGTTIAIKNGKIEGNKVSFLVSIDFGGMPLDLNYTGVVTPEQLKLTMDFAGMPLEIVAKKVN